MGNIKNKEGQKTPVNLSTDLSEILSSGGMVSGTITEIIKKMEVGQARIVGPLVRRTDIQSCVRKMNNAIKENRKFEQSQVYIFHPSTGITMQNCYLLHRIE